MEKKSSAIKKRKSSWLWKWSEPESTLKVIPRSKTQRLAKQATLANKDAEKAIGRAYQQELLRMKAISEAMYKTGKAVRYSFISSGRQFALRLSALNRKILSVANK